MSLCAANGLATRGLVTKGFSDQPKMTLPSTNLLCDALHRPSPDAERLGHLQNTHTLRELPSNLPLGRAVELVAAGREGASPALCPCMADNGRSRWISPPSAPPDPESPTQTRGWQGGRNRQRRAIPAAPAP